LMCVECFQSHDCGDVNLGEPRESEDMKASRREVDRGFSFRLSCGPTVRSCLGRTVIERV
jgi:hypothetical protein